MKTPLGPANILFPVPAALIVSGSFDEPNIITISWIGITGSNPPSIGIHLDRSRYSLELIRKHKNFTVNIPSADLVEETDYCGLVSGKDRKKFEDTGLTPFKSTKIKAPMIKECPCNMECIVMKEVELNDSILIIGEVVETHIDRDKVDHKDKTKINISKVTPLAYCDATREYWTLGRRVGRVAASEKKIEARLKEEGNEQ